MQRRWSINGRFLNQPMTGVQRYAREIVKALDLLLSERHPLTAGLDIELLLPWAEPARDNSTRLALANIPCRSAGGGKGHVWEQLSLPAEALGGVLSLCNTGPVMASRHIVCIHDTNTRTRPSSYSLAFRSFYRGLHALLGRRAATIATVSQHSAGEIARFAIAGRATIIVASNGHEHARTWVARHTPATRSVAGPRTIVVLGSPARHKNIARVLALAPRLGAHGLSIAVAGQSDPRVFRSVSPEAAVPNVHWLGRLDDGALAALLGDSLCLAFPSLDEGFGLPPLEAFVRGCPVVASTSASLPEVCGDAALYASPHDGEAWLAAFLRLDADPRLRDALIAAGHDRARRFSWRRSAEIYLEAMVRADGLPIPVPAFAGAA